MLYIFPFNTFIPSGDSDEAKSLIEKHRNKRGSDYIWYEELGKDLINHISRPELILEVLKQLVGFGNYYLYQVNAALVEALSLSQIQDLLQDKVGNNLIYTLQIYLNSTNIPAEANKLRRLYLKIERVRIPVIVNDRRPYIGTLVDPAEDLGIDPSRAGDHLPYAFRFGGSHDGEHWLTKTIGAEVRATAEIKGTVLTYYNTGEEGHAVMILLDNTNIIMLLKDLQILGPRIKQSPGTGGGAGFAITDKSGRPLSKVRVNAGDLIGTTAYWKISSARLFYSGYEQGEFGTFHFAFLKYEHAQQYRSNISSADGVAIDDIAMQRNAENFQKTQSKKIVVFPLSWFIPPLSPDSPVKCFK